MSNMLLTANSGYIDELDSEFTMNWWVEHSTGIIILFALVLAFILVLVLKKIIKRREQKYMDDLNGHEFEYYCAQLLADSGYQDVEVTKGSGDFGVDILCEKDGVSYAVQCKCYDGPVGVHAIQEVYAGKAYYDRMVGVVMCNQYFTEPAVKMAKKLNIMLFDRGYITEMERELR